MIAGTVAAVGHGRARGGDQEVKRPNDDRSRDRRRRLVFSGARLARRDRTGPCLQDRDPDDGICAAGLRVDQRADRRVAGDREGDRHARCAATGLRREGKITVDLFLRAVGEPDLLRCLAHGDRECLAVRTAELIRHRHRAVVGAGCGVGVGSGEPVGRRDRVVLRQLQRIGRVGDARRIRRDAFAVAAAVAPVDCHRQR